MPAHRPVQLVVASVLLAGVVLAPAADALHPTLESCDDDALGCGRAPDPSTGTSGDAVGSTASDMVRQTVVPPVDNLHSDVTRWYDNKCEDHVGDWRTTRDAGSTVGDAIRIRADVGLEVSWFAHCQARKDSLTQHDKDTYEFEVEKGDLVFAVVSEEAACTLALPGYPDGRVDRKLRDCNRPAIAEASGSAFILTWPVEGVPNGASAPRPYLVGAWTGSVTVGPELTSAPSLGVIQSTYSLEDDAPSVQRTASETGSRPPMDVSETSADAPVPSETTPPWMSLMLVGLTVAGLVAAWLHRRLTREEALDHEIRSTIVDRCRDEPGITPAELAGELDVAHETLLHHVRVLEDLDLLVVDRDGKYLRLFPVGQPDRRARELVGALRRDGRSDVLRLLRSEPGLCVSEIARRLDRHRTTVQHHVDALEEEGLVRENGGPGRALEVPGEVIDVWCRLEG